MHHALDAATIALAAHYFPLQARGQDQKGRIWQALLRRYRTPEEKDFLYKLGIFDKYQRTRRDKGGNEYQETDVRLSDLPKSVKEQLRRSLAQCRVMQHVPSDRSGAKTKLTTWGVEQVDNSRVKLRQRGFIDDSGKPNLNPDKSRKRSEKDANPNGKGEDRKWLRIDKLLGPKPKGDRGKLKEIKGAMIVEENFGLALDPEPTVIPFQDVTARLATLRKANGGKPVRVLRNGMLVSLSGHGERDGIWMVATIQETDHKIDLINPHLCSMKKTVLLPDGKTKKRNRSGPEVWRERPYRQLHNPSSGKTLTILPRRYTGHPLTD